MKNTIGKVLLALGLITGCSNSDENTVSTQKNLIQMLNSQKDNIIVKGMENYGNLGRNYKRFNIVDKTTGELIGSLIVLGDGAKAEYITRKNNPEYFVPELNFDKIKNDYPSVSVIVALSFVDSWSTLDIEGANIDNGKVINSDKNSKFNGVVTFDKGKIKIYNKKTDFSKGIAGVIDFVKSKKIDLAEQFLVIDNGQITDNIPPLGKDRKEKFRFLVEKDGTYAIVNFSRKMTLNEVLVALKNIGGIKKAVYMDAGYVSEGKLYDKNDKGYKIGDVKLSNSTYYSNIIVFY